MMDVRQIALEELNKLKSSRDTEAAHGDADKALCKLLTALGYQDVVDAWDAVPKWYA